MTDKLNFNQRIKSQNALNKFENSHGRKFHAMILVRMKGSNRSTIYEKQEVFILRGQYADHNMPYVFALDQTYDSQYTVIESHGDCLTIKLLDRTIDIIPHNDEETEEENDYE
ncbi:hypothetical protein [Ruminococcus sp.]|uniref:hypothetical protein n=1 Tax=Ruminococcus sp. TaxID=41978 RepID=UPI0025F273F2|nr:hypothetical protein [Ruminococcus sp.]